jgi:hypothetical protein
LEDKVRPRPDFTCTFNGRRLSSRAIQRLALAASAVDAGAPVITQIGDDSAKITSSEATYHPMSPVFDRGTPGNAM